ncbi:hypothetical protein I305_00275 [Cryptococcus gattii E566]|nr:hypothetical protein I305_00275 [Cryptococcus gattii E566]
MAEDGLLEDIEVEKLAKDKFKTEFQKYVNDHFVDCRWPIAGNGECFARPSVVGDPTPGQVLHVPGGNQELDPANIYMARDIPLLNEKVRVAPDCLDIRIWERSFSPPKIIPLRKEVLDSMQPVTSIHIPSSRSPRAVESFMVVTIPIYRHTASS